LREAAAAILDRAGHATLQASSGDEALRIVKVDPSAIDIVSLDAEMPGLSGQETFAALRTLSPTLRIIVMSGLASGTTDAIEDTNWLFLPKPFGREQLLEAIDTVTRTASA
jgi:DNA-binding NtrC family response regulator